MIYVELYARNDIAVINVNFKEFCLGLTLPPGGIGFYMFIYEKLFPFGFLMVLISAITVLALYVFIFVKTFTYNKNLFIIFAMFALFIFLIPLLYFFIFTASILIIATVIVLTVFVFTKLKIPFYNKYKLIVFTFLVFLSYFLLFGAWIDTKYSIFYKCAEFYL